MQYLPLCPSVRPSVCLPLSLFIYIYIYLFVFLNVYVYIYIFISICTYLSIHVLIYSNTYICIAIPMCIYLHIRMCMHVICMSMYVYIYIIHIHILYVNTCYVFHICICMCMYVYTHGYDDMIETCKETRIRFSVLHSFRGPFFCWGESTGSSPLKGASPCGDQGTTAHAHMARGTLLDLEKYGILHWKCVRVKTFFRCEHCG